MKKQKKQKLLNLWNKLKKPLMILSFVGNILFLLFIIVGCVGVNKKSIQTKADDIGEVFTLRNTEWSFNSILQNKTPAGVDFYIDTPYLETYNLIFTDIDTTYYGIRFYKQTSPMRVQYIQPNQYGGQDYVDVYKIDSTLGVYRWEDTDYKNITFYNGYEPNQDYDNRNLIDWLTINASIVNADFTTFTFNPQINYNAPYGGSLESPFVTSGGASVHTKTYSFPLFYVNGELYDTIVCWFIDGFGMRYVDTKTGEIRTNDNQGYVYFLYMEYKNSSLNVSKSVNYRRFYSGNDPTADNTVQTSLDYGSNWLNSSYRYLKFQNPLTPTQRDSLAHFNNDTLLNGISQTGEYVGLGNVFNLISQSFGAFTNIFKIEILPNISIGLLIFLPLIVGIILFIIWLVKR